jgi:hypothetical protein
MATTKILQQGKPCQQEEDQLWEEVCYQKGCAKAREEAQQYLQALGERLHQQRPRGWEVRDWRERTLVTRFGEIRVRRRFYQDQEGNYHFGLDEHLGWEKGQVATPGVTESVVTLAAQVPLRQAEKTVQQLTAGVISAMTVHRLVQRVGQRGIQQEEEEWRACFERGEEGKLGQQVAEVLYTEADGVWVHLQREKQKHYEVKSGIVYAGWRRLNQRVERYALVGKRVYCHANPHIPFWEGATLEWAKKYELSQVKLVVVGGDGANWIGEEKVEGFGRVVGQLDGYHLARACGRALGKERGGQLYQAIRAGQVAEAHQLLREGEAAGSKGMEKARAYVEVHIRKGIDWRHRVAQVPCGARSLGTMESNGDKLVANRMKKRGMSWTIRGAQHLAKVLQLNANGEVATLCQSRWRSEGTGFKGPRGLARSPTLKSTNNNGQWLQATIPALVGPHTARPWAQALRALAYGAHPLN